MDLSALIFVGLAVAWVVYLVPRVLAHQAEERRARPVEQFSDRLRVVARRDAVDARSSRLVTARPVVRDQTATQSSSTTQAAQDQETQDQGTKAAQVRPPSEEDLRRRRDSARRALKRRRRVLAVLLLALAGTAGAAAYGLIQWWYAAIPAGLLAAWLIACRVMVKGEHEAWDRLTVPASREEDQNDSADPADSADDEADVPEEIAVARNEQGFDEVAPEAPTAVIHRQRAAAGGLWDPVPVTLPTYVDKAPAPRRAVRTIDLDSTGVWSSGRNEADSALVRDSEAQSAQSASLSERATGT